MKISYNAPALVGKEREYLEEALTLARLGDGASFRRRCEALLTSEMRVSRAILTNSCSQALELAALLLDVAPGDEIIMPSFTFVSAANAFVLRGARIVFVDIDPHTMNLDVEKTRAAITPRTKILAPVHYAGVSCDMDGLLAIARETGIVIVEDAAHSIGSFNRGRPLGSIGHLGCLSFHGSKNIQCGSGGALLINDPSLLERAEILAERGTDRARFLRGDADKYAWQDIGLNCEVSELTSAFLLAQLECIRATTEKRLSIWNRYQAAFADAPDVEVPYPPDYAAHNAHIFWMKTRTEFDREQLIEGLRLQGIEALSHYVPLHATSPGRRYGMFCGKDAHTTAGALRLLRLPLHLQLTDAAVERIIGAAHDCLRLHERKSRAR